MLLVGALLAVPLVLSLGVLAEAVEPEVEDPPAELVPISSLSFLLPDDDVPEPGSVSMLIFPHASSSEELRPDEGLELSGSVFAGLLLSLPQAAKADNIMVSAKSAKSIFFIISKSFLSLSVPIQCTI